MIVTSLSSRSVPLAFTTPQSGIAAHPFGHASTQAGCADARTFFSDHTREFFDGETRFVNDKIGLSDRAFGLPDTKLESADNKLEWLITPPYLCDNETMIVYIVQKLHWEYTDIFYEIFDHLPIRGFADRGDAEVYRQKLEVAEREHWEKHDAKTPQGQQVRDQGLFQVIAVEYEP